MHDDRTGVRFTGAVYTPEGVAASLVKHLSSSLKRQPANILEPSVGDGEFLRALRKQKFNGRVTLVDIDDQVIERLQQDEPVDGGEADFVISDFLAYASELLRSQAQSFDLIIGNPPFIRAHNFSSSLKAALLDLADVTGYERAEFKNSWAAFLAASSHLVSGSGVLAFILPYELITVAYGQKALKRLLAQFARIDIYISDAKAFPEIDQDALIVIAQKDPAEKSGLYINKVASLHALGEQNCVPVDISTDGDPSLAFNSFLLSPDSLDLLRKLRALCPRLDKYAGSAPGIVSAANNFFILTKNEVERRGFEEFVVPILKKGSFASSRPVFTAADFDQLQAREPTFLLNISGPRDALPVRLQSYIKEGEAALFHERYKCRNRQNWYEVPMVKRELGFVFKRAHSYARLCVNEANVYLTDTAYGLRMNEGFSIRGLTYSFYNSMTMLFAEIDGRFYGGGVLELSPTEFRGLPIVYHEPSDEEFATFLAVHERAGGEVEPILDFGDEWLSRKLRLSSSEVKLLRQSWSDVRKHRLRHSGRSKN
ncbi:MULTISPECIES: Eco57I restriction-modification methylase domain-containing protein [unclassified Agrobacterium]|uniref:Eco57I restriction-modification methylase domain-containing protein n=1 Tax=unclassified Agrobacterium TaxID=2632611 RepID=UPI000367BDCC|nr:MULTISPECIES: Eco57I restriction-modification methylase domain-containing protein [unclassified Agrobacterium]SNB61990.1 Methyltransferase small domain-containing protein [Agrobacterium sp. 719_389]